MSASVTTLADALRSVYLAQRAEIDLLSHASTANPIVAATLEEDLREKLEQAKAFAEGQREEETLSSAVKQVDAYIESTHLSETAKSLHPEFEPAVDALREVVDINLSHADAGKSWHRDWTGGATASA